MLVVEVKNRTNATAEWAAQLRFNLAEMGALPSAPYFLLALPDRFFLWTQPSSNEAVPPDYEFDAETVLRPYAAKLSFPLNDLSKAGFESSSTSGSRTWCGTGRSTGRGGCTRPGWMSS